MSGIYEKLLVPQSRVDEIQPLDNQILVKITFPMSKTKGGIIVTQEVISSEIRSRIFGTVLKKGPAADFCEVGDEVVFVKYAGAVVCINQPSDHGAEDGFELRLMKDTELLAVLKKDK